MYTIALQFRPLNRILIIECTDGSIRTEISQWMNKKNWCKQIKESETDLTIQFANTCSADDMCLIQQEILKRWQKEIPLDLS